MPKTDYDAKIAELQRKKERQETHAQIRAGLDEVKTHLRDRLYVATASKLRWMAEAAEKLAALDDGHEPSEHATRGSNDKP